MPKVSNNILDRLTKILKTRQDALNRFDRRLVINPQDERSVKAFEEASDLISNLGTSGAMEYDRIIRSKPGKRVEREALRMMPQDIIDDYFPDNGWY